MGCANSIFSETWREEDAHLGDIEGANKRNLELLSPQGRESDAFGGMLWGKTGDDSDDVSLFDVQIVHQRSGKGDFWKKEGGVKIWVNKNGVGAARDPLRPLPP